MANDDTEAIMALKAHPSLWIHGAGFAGATWDGLRTDLPLSLAPDLAGHGNAPALAKARVELLADALMPLLKEGMVLIGHSLGGMVALELTRRSPVRLGALITVEAVPTVRDRWIGRFGPGLVRPLLAYLPPRLLANISAIGEAPEIRAEIKKRIAEQTSSEIVAAFDAARLYDGRRHLASVNVPTLVIVGQANTATHRGARLMAQSIEGAEHQVLTGGHMLHIENPKGLREAVGWFLLSKLGTGLGRQVN